MTKTAIMWIVELLLLICVSVFTQGSVTFFLFMSVTYSTHTHIETVVKRWYDVHTTVYRLFASFFAEHVAVKISETAAARVAALTCEHGHRNEMQDVTQTLLTCTVWICFYSIVHRWMLRRFQQSVFRAVVIISYPGGRMSMSQVKYLLLGLICSLISD